VLSRAKAGGGIGSISKDTKGQRMGIGKGALIYIVLDRAIFN
jgi:hypothetical protein